MDGKTTAGKTILSFVLRIPNRVAHTNNTLVLHISGHTAEKPVTPSLFNFFVSLNLPLVLIRFWVSN